MPKDNRENQNWKEIKKKIESWAKKAKNSPDLITPIFAHTPINPVETRKDSLLSPLEVSFFTTKYTYLVTLVKKNQNYLGTLYTYLMQSDTEVPLSVDQKTFGLHDYKNICEFISLPNKLFKIKGVRKKVMTFNRTTMTERKFEERVEIWREKQT
jgi:hypothetical protein